MTSVLQIQNVTKRYVTIDAVSKINLNIESGDFLAIMGSSGSGKSTLLRMIAGLEEPTEGDILLNGKSTRGLPAHERDTPMVWQNLALFPFLNVVENVEFALKMRGVSSKERRKRAMYWLERLEIGQFAGRAISDLSGGQKQRVALARSLIVEPPVLLLDEPLSALDAHLSVRMQAVLTELQRELGITFIYVTHSHSEAFSMANRVVIMRDGKIEQIGSPREIYAKPASRFVAEFLGGNNIFTGRVAHDAQGNQHLKTEDGIISLPKELSQQDLNQDIDLVISADRIELKDSTDNANNFSCKLLGEEFIGSTVNLYLETESGREIVAQVSQRRLESSNIHRGQKITVSWATEDSHIISA